MRISNAEKEFIKSYWNQNFPGSKVYLFGSRADDYKKGGDIDLLVLNNSKIGLLKKIDFLDKFMLNFGEQKVDIVTYTFSENAPFKNIALSSSVEL